MPRQTSNYIPKIWFFSFVCLTLFFLENCRLKNWLSHNLLLLPSIVSFVCLNLFDLIMRMWHKTETKRTVYNVHIEQCAHLYRLNTWMMSSEKFMCDRSRSWQCNHSCSNVSCKLHTTFIIEMISSDKLSPKFSTVWHWFELLLCYEFDPLKILDSLRPIVARIYSRSRVCLFFFRAVFLIVLCILLLLIKYTHYNYSINPSNHSDLISLISVFDLRNQFVCRFVFASKLCM